MALCPAYQRTNYGIKFIRVGVIHAVVGMMRWPCAWPTNDRIMELNLLEWGNFILQWLKLLQNTLIFLLQPIWNGKNFHAVVGMMRWPCARPTNERIKELNLLEWE
jgi:hypothetical protein